MTKSNKPASTSTSWSASTELLVTRSNPTGYTCLMLDQFVPEDAPLDERARIVTFVERETLQVLIRRQAEPSEPPGVTRGQARHLPGDDVLLVVPGGKDADTTDTEIHASRLWGQVCWDGHKARLLYWGKPRLSRMLLWRAGSREPEVLKPNAAADLGTELRVGDRFGTNKTCLSLRSFIPSTLVKGQLGNNKPPHSWMTTDAGMAAQFARVIVRARAGLSILLLGPTGVGKQVMAEWLHWFRHGGSYTAQTGDEADGRLVARYTAAKPVPNRPFVVFDCGGIVDTLLEAQLFGICEGAASGVSARLGALRASVRGTLFVDELHLLPMAAQARLLRFLSEGVIQPVGSDIATTIPDHRRPLVLAAAKPELLQRVRDGRFLRDLYFRITNGGSVTIPGLMNRPDDAEAMARLFLGKALDDKRLQAAWSGHVTPKRGVELSDGAVAELRSHPWPGNLRELRGAVERGVVASMSEGAEEIRAEHLELDPLLVQPYPGQGDLTDPRRLFELLVRHDFVRQAVMDQLEKEKVASGSPGKNPKSAARRQVERQIKKWVDNLCREPKTTATELVNGLWFDGPAPALRRRRLDQFFNRALTDDQRKRVRQQGTWDTVMRAAGGGDDDRAAQSAPGSTT